jgi:hypothetical protein
MLLKGSRRGEGFPSLLQYIEFHFPVISYTYFLVMGMSEYIPIYIPSVRFDMDCIITFLMLNTMNTDRFIMLTPIDFLSSVWTFMFEVMEMSEDFPHCFPNPVTLHF